MKIKLKRYVIQCNALLFELLGFLIGGSCGIFHSIKRVNEYAKDLSISRFFYPFTKPVVGPTNIGINLSKYMTNTGRAINLNCFDIE